MSPALVALGTHRLVSEREVVTWPSVFELLLTGADGEKVFFSCFTPRISDNLSLFFHQVVCFSPTKSFLCPLPTGEIESVAMYEKSFSNKKKDTVSHLCRI